MTTRRNRRARHKRAKRRSQQQEWRRLRWAERGRLFAARQARAETPARDGALFIGGPLDGQWREVERGTIHRCAVAQGLGSVARYDPHAPEVRVVTYHRHRMRRNVHRVPVELPPLYTLSMDPPTFAEVARYKEMMGC